VRRLSVAGIVGGVAVIGLLIALYGVNQRTSGVGFFVPTGGAVAEVSAAAERVGLDPANAQFVCALAVEGVSELRAVIPASEAVQKSVRASLAGAKRFSSPGIGEVLTTEFASYSFRAGVVVIEANDCVSATSDVVRLSKI
jgi:hypothetical protein